MNDVIFSSTFAKRFDALEAAFGRRTPAASKKESKDGRKMWLRKLLTLNKNKIYKK